MLPIVTPAEMRAIDADAPEPVAVLIDRAGFATARAARRLLDRTYGRRVAVLAGPGHNGDDGRSAARLLTLAGVRVELLHPTRAPARLDPDRFDLVIDAAFGTGFRGRFAPPEVGPVPVLAVDIASGVDGLTGAVGGRALTARATVTFAALKPGLLLGEGPAASGVVEVVDIGLDVSRCRAWLLEPGDLARWPRRPTDAHKWHAACWVVGGSPGMTGAPVLAARGAQRAGAGYVRLSVPGLAAGPDGAPVEVVGVGLPAGGWAEAVAADAARVAAFVVGPGLGRGEDDAAGVRRLLGVTDQPVVLDGDGLRAVAGHEGLLRSRPGPTVLTPHDGELTALIGAPPGPDRFQVVRHLARATGSVVLAKGPTTVVAHPDGRILVSTAGDQRLATAGTGDVLAGIVGALLAQGVEPWWAAALAAEAHGRAAAAGPAVGLVAGDVADHLPGVLSGVSTMGRPGGARAGGSAGPRRDQGGGPGQGHGLAGGGRPPVVVGPAVR